MPKTIACGIVTAHLLIGSAVWGCPYCGSELGQDVAAGIFNEHFVVNAALTLLPIPVLFLIVFMIHFGLPRPRIAIRKSGSDTSRQTATATRVHPGEP
ncbi:MAG: hypothetical protein AB7O38_18775 [Pirellulaceae bacterium]